jgi:ATP-binding cassette, subfamily B, bacterial MsbA
MKNFLRVLRYSWTYRKRLIFSICCALVAAALWGLNFTAIYPVMKILGDKKTLHEWVDHEIDTGQAEERELSVRLSGLREHLRKVEEWEVSPLDPGLKERSLHETTKDIARFESKLDSVSSRLWRLHALKRHVIRWLPQDPFETLAWLLLLVLIGVALKGLFEFGQEYLVGSITNRTLYDLRNRFYRHSIHQDMRQFQEAGSAELMTRFTNDMETLGNGLKILYGRVIAEPLRAMACIAIASWISWQLTLLFLVVVPAGLYLMIKTSRLLKRATRRVLERMSSIYKILQETFQGIRVVKAFTMEPYERRRFSRATRDYHRRAMRVIIIDALAGPVIELLGVAAVILALLVGAYLVLNNKTHLFGMRMSQNPIEMETLMQLFALLAATADPVRKLSSVYTKLQSGAAAADRVFAYLDRTAEVQPNSDGPRLERHSQSIEFRNVCFSYNKDKEVLTNIALTVRHGETIAIVGANGCGKSTLLGLLPRFYDSNHGSILIDGLELRKVNLRSLRRQIGIVTQDTILFDDTIYNNILYGNRRATRTQVEEAAKKAFAHEVIVKLPQGYETLAGEAGKALSGGEKQRIALARAILRDPSILILDEFTSQIDPLSDALMHQAVKEFKEGRTTFLITHKMHTLEIADRIVVLDEGRIDSIGTHAELLRTSPLYQRLFEAQFQLRSGQSDLQRAATSQPGRTPAQKEQQKAAAAVDERSGVNPAVSAQTAPSAEPEKQRAKTDEGDPPDEATRRRCA